MFVKQMEALNLLAGQWSYDQSSEAVRVFDPASEEVLAHAALASAADTVATIEVAAKAFPAWRMTPPQERIQYLFKFRQLLLRRNEEIARITTRRNGKTIAESRAELQRGIENVELPCGSPTLMQGYNLEDVASGIDETMIRQPLGVTPAITPFNFPAMIPLWFLPYAIACGNTFILKPSERVPLTARLLMELLLETGIPEGVVSLVVGGKPAVDVLLRHPAVKAISFVGSTPVARYVYAEASTYGKRVQCEGGAKNYVVVIPDADLAMSAKIVSDSAFGCAGQRCLAISTAITVGDAEKPFTNALVDIASNLCVGNGLDDGVQMGPVISPSSRKRIESLIDRGLDGGGKTVLDGRDAKSRDTSAFLKPTILSGVENGELASTDIFGPVLALQSVNDLDQAIEILSRSAYGNAASIFTSSGKHARKFRYEAPAGNVGVNIGVAAPMAYFPSSGWKGSFLGALHGQGRDGVEFYTDKNVVVERWPGEWSRRF
jgi:malonate-semialdehyde dehydrogenase (acetylating)/methylmalonate-semialdehyde dehydrogenase